MDTRPLNILQSIYAVQNVLDFCHIVLIIFNEYAYVLLYCCLVKLLSRAGKIRAGT